MGEKLELSGRCLCGAVSFDATASRPRVSVCHCDMCRRWSAGPFMSLNCEAVTFENQDNIGRIRSSDWAERGFCTKCGSNLFYHLVDSGDHQMAAGLFDDQSKLRMSLQVFTDRKPDFYDFANETRKMTAAEVIALYAPALE
ncbi:GFA family protein [Oricola cellulosilytica]|uniref:GFA family protein n=1 Tax=Oricola cellulosilytica TaxID=1429082 RepID=A0A4V2MNQ3_9HYPH|nr:GFA family protein [Oricola cellulosilytica]TCD14067.1 GFA family protein [Oricola cellulosilytica]